VDRTICTEVLEGVGVDKAAGTGVIITRLEIVETCLRIIVITTVTNGVDVEDIGDGGVRLYYTKPQNACQYKETPPTEVGGEHCCFSKTKIISHLLTESVTIHKRGAEMSQCALQYEFLLRQHRQRDRLFGIRS